MTNSGCQGAGFPSRLHHMQQPEGEGLVYDRLPRAHGSQSAVPSDAVCFDRSDLKVSIEDPEGVLPPPQPPPHMTTLLTFAPVSRHPQDLHQEARPLVTYHIPMDKARSVPKVLEDTSFHLDLRRILAYSSNPHPLRHRLNSQLIM